MQSLEHSLEGTAMNNRSEMDMSVARFPESGDSKRHCEPENTLTFDSVVASQEATHSNPLLESSISADVKIHRYAPRQSPFLSSMDRGCDYDHSPRAQLSVSTRENVNTSPSCTCCCHHTHHHHHHHTIVINDPPVKEVFERAISASHRPNDPRYPLKINVRSTTLPYSWANESYKTGRKIPTKQCAQFPEVPHTPQEFDSGDDMDSVQIRERDNHRQQYHCQKGKKKRNRYCPRLSIAMATLLTVLVVVILSLLSGLIYFLVRGHVPTAESSSEETKVPNVSTILNQTTICGKFPKEYLPFASRTLQEKRPTNLHPPENDNRINISQAARIIGGIPTNIVQYPWQESQTTIVSNSPGPENLVDATMVRGRIFGGSDTLATRFPWQVQLYGVSLWEKNRGMTCGGALIMRNWVVTAAHCTEVNENYLLWTAYMGMSIITEKDKPPAQSSKVLKIIQHEKYTNDLSYDYDISLLKLETPVTFSPSVQPICIPRQTDYFKDGTPCYVSGWGATSDSGQANSPKTLQHAQVDVIGYDTCRQEDWLDVLVTDRMICAGKYDGSKDACQGDSGGPLSCYSSQQKTWTLAGIVSWGIACGQPKQPGVYTKITFFVDWIWKKIGNHEGWIKDNNVVESEQYEGSA